MSARALTPLLTNAQIHRIERLRIGASRRFTNRGRGEHLAGRGGASTEFADFRDYHEGDDIRYIDWNIYSRLRRPYLKIFRTEEEMHVVIIVDASASMRFDGKHGRALSLAAAFGISGLLAGERVSVVTFNAAKSPERLPPRSASVSPCAGSFRLPRLGTRTRRGHARRRRRTRALRLHRSRGAALLLDDFLTPGDLRRTFNQLRWRQPEILATTSMARRRRPADRRRPPPRRQRNRRHARRLLLPALMDAYHDHRAGFLRGIEQGARRRGGNFLSLDAAEDLDHQLFDTLRRRGWLA
ncbi:MAG: DUF58 domain-containing protein [Kiritimatiellia bacterium]